MTDTSEAELPPQTNGIANDIDVEDSARLQQRPADIDADVREMERRKRVEVIMNSKMFREELERIIETQLKDGGYPGTHGLMQQISDMMGVAKQTGGANVFRNPNCVVPINDIRGIEAMSYGKGEKILRCKLAAVFRLIDLYGWLPAANGLVTARLNQDEEHFLVNPYGMMFHEVTASSLIKVGMQGNVIEQGTTNFSVNISAFSLHAAVHAARPDIRCIINVHTPSVVAISALKHGILPLSQESVVIGEVSTHTYLGGLLDPEEKDKLARNLGPNNKVLLLTNQGALCCGETIEEAFYNARNTVLACESQLKLMPAGIDNLILLNDEIKKKMYDAAHRAPESSPRPDQPSILEGKVERKWRVGGIEFEALMRMLDNAGFRTGYIYRHPLVKGDPPKPKNDVELPPAVSSLGYLLEEEELYKQGLWRKLEGGKKGHDRSRWLNSPNVYQKVEILETGTPDPKKITKWVAEGSPTHSSTPVKIDSALQFVPQGTNPKEFKQKQQQIKDYRRADKISAGPQSHILEGVTWEEARKMQDASVTHTGDQVVLMGAASKGIIQRGHQHNAMVYKSPYAKNPFDSVTDEELDEYKKVVEKKSKGEYDTDFSESEGLSSAQINKRMDSLNIRSPTSVTSETEEESRDEPQVLRIETKQAPRPSQPEVVLSDVDRSATEQFLRAERVSVNSYKSGNAVEVLSTINPNFQPQQYYRTLSHAGHPKGSYCIPNPVHFHVVHQSHLPRPVRPVLVRMVNGVHKSHTNPSHYVYQQFATRCKRKDNTTITLSLANTHTVSLDMPLQTVRDFIRPFADALQLLGPSEMDNQPTQITCHLPEEKKKIDYEQDIIDNIRKNLFDSTESESSDFTDYNVEEESRTTLSRSSWNSWDFNLSEEQENYRTTTPEMQCEPIPNMKNARQKPLSRLNSTGCSEQSYVGETPKSRRSYDSVAYTASTNSSLTEEISINSIELAIKRNFERQGENLFSTDLFNGEYATQYNFDEFSSNEALAVHENREFITSSAQDEGLGDTFSSASLLSEIPLENNNLQENNDPVIDDMSKLILDYLLTQCHEIEELVFFPEVLHDVNVNKLIFQLLEIYKKNYANGLNHEEKDLLRFILIEVVMKRLEIVDSCTTDENNDSVNSPSLSDKLFTITEFLSDILDLFFKLTEEQPKKNTSTLSQVDEEVISFKKARSKKSGDECFWISMIPSSPIGKRSLELEVKPAINVDDIPLPPPKDSYDYNAGHNLSPILEEPPVRGRNGVSDDMMGGGDNGNVNGIPDGNCVLSRGVVISNAVMFLRTPAPNKLPFLSHKSVVFSSTPTLDDNIDCDADEGDWMGYDKAKF